MCRAAPLYGEHGWIAECRLIEENLKIADMARPSKRLLRSNMQMARRLKTLPLLIMTCVVGCAHTDLAAPIYRCEALNIRTGDEIVSTMKITSTVHGDIGTFKHCNGIFGVGFDENILSSQFVELRTSLARQAYGDPIEITITGLIIFKLRDSLKYPGSAHFVSVDKWELKNLPPL